MKFVPLCLLIVACGGGIGSSPGSDDASVSGSSVSGSSVRRGVSPAAMGEHLSDAGSSPDGQASSGGVDSFSDLIKQADSSPNPPARDSSALADAGASQDSKAAPDAPGETLFIFEDGGKYKVYPSGVNEHLSKIARDVCTGNGAVRPDGANCRLYEIFYVSNAVFRVSVFGACKGGVCCPGCWDGMKCHVTARGLREYDLLIYSHSDSPSACGLLGSQCMACQVGGSCSVGGVTAQCLGPRL